MPLTRTFKVGEKIRRNNIKYHPSVGTVVRHEGQYNVCDMKNNAGYYYFYDEDLVSAEDTYDLLIYDLGPNQG